MRRRLCMVVHGPYPVGEPRVAREARSALAAGFDVDVVAMRQPGEPRLDEIDGVVVHRLPYLRRSRSGPAALLYEYVGFTGLATAYVARLHLRRRYAVVHVHNPPDFLVAAGLLPKLMGARLVFDVHDLAPDLFEMRLGGRRGADIVVRALRRVERAALAVADAVVTVHEPYRRELLARAVPDEKIVVVMNSLDEELIPPDGEPAADDFRIVYHGTITPHYGIEIALEAFAGIAADVPRACFEVYGAGDALAGLRRRARELGIVDRVVLPSRVIPHREVLEKVQGASVGLVVNLAIERNKVALPTKLLEYVAMRVPVIASELPAVREHFSEQELSFVPAADPDALAAALRAVASDPVAAAARADAALRRYQAYRWEIYSERYRDLLDRVVVSAAA